MNNKRSVSKLLKESFLATLLVFISVWVLFLIINISFKPFNFVAKTLKEVNLTDFYFSGIQAPVADTTIVLVNIEDLGRQEIASLVDSINQVNPAVIGLDIFFSDIPDSIGDPLLSESLRKAAAKLVLAGFYNEEEQTFNKDYRTFPNSSYGHANILTNEDRTAVVRKFQPVYRTADSAVYSFTAMIAKKYNQVAYDQLIRRGEKQEYINYKGNKNSFLQLNHADILQGTAADIAFLENKIVLIGFLGGRNKSTEDFNDIFYTPVNTHYYGRALPDMYGLLIHANIVSMIIEDNYIHVPGDWLIFILSFIIAFLHIIPFIYFYVNRHLWYHVFVKLAQLVSFSAILLVVFLVFKNTAVLVSTKYILLPIILAADILYLYEAMAVLIYKKTGKKSIFIHEHEHHEDLATADLVTEAVNTDDEQPDDQQPIVTGNEEQ